MASRIPKDLAEGLPDAAGRGAQVQIVDSGEHTWGSWPMERGERAYLRYAEWGAAT